jgi:uncharacterized protein (TIRG00374 family)
MAVAGTVLVVLVGSVVLFRTVDLREMGALLRSADHLLVGAALLVYSLSWAIRGRRYGDVLAAMGRRCGFGFLTATIFVSQTANLVVPVRAGDGVRAYLLKQRRRIDYPTGFASLAVERVFDLLSIATLGGAAFVVLVLDSRGITSVGFTLGTTVAVGIATAVVAVSAVTVLVARSDLAIAPAIRDRVEHTRLSRLVEALVGFGTSIRVVAADPRAVGTIYAGSVVIWILDILTAVLVLAALIGGFGGPSGLMLVVVGALAVSVGNLAKVLPLSQGGIGLYEAAFTTLVVAIAPISVETAVTAAILDHALKNAVTLVGGGGATLLLNASPTAVPDDDTGSNATSPYF